MRDTGEFLFTSELVSEGHPDKVADRLSDTVLDAYLAADPYSRVACETLVTTNRVVFAGETRGPPPSRPTCLRIWPAWQSTTSATISQASAGGRRSRLPSARAVRGHRAGRRCRRKQGRRRRRSGHDVRLCLSRDRTLMPAPIYYAHAILHRSATCGTSATSRWKACCPTPKARSRCATSTASRSARPASSCRPTCRGPRTGRDPANAVADRREHAAGGLDVSEARVPRTRPASSSRAALTATAA